MFGNVLEQFDCLDKVLGWASRGDLRLGATVDQVFLGQLHEEVGVQFNVEVEISHGRLCLLNVQVQRGVQQADCFHFVALKTPLKLCLKECMV